MNKHLTSNGYTIESFTGGHLLFTPAEPNGPSSGPRFLPAPLVAALREFFRAEQDHWRWPWASAEDGEVWLLTIDGKETAAVYDASIDMFMLGLDGVPDTSNRITAGRRIWPEEGGN